MPSRLRPLSLGLLVVLAAPAAAPAQLISVQIIAQSDQTIAGFGKPTSFRNPVINNVGDVAMLGTYSGGSSTGNNPGAAVFIKQSGQPLGFAANSLTTAPGAGTTFTGFGTPDAGTPGVTLNDSSAVAFVGTYSGGEGVFTKAPVPGAVTAVARTGTTFSGGTFSSDPANTFPLQPALNNNGAVAFRGLLSSPGGVFTVSNAGGSLAAVAGPGITEPNPPGSSTFTNGQAPALIDGGRVAVRALDSTSRWGIYTGTAANNLTAVAYAGQSAPVQPAGTVFDFNGFQFDPVMNAAGRVAFLTTDNDSRPGIFLYNNTTGTLSAVAHTSVPGPGGLTFGGFSPPTINSADTVAFRAATSSGTGLLVKTAAGPLTTVALGGQAAPGTASTFTDFSFPLLNNNDRIAFKGTLATGAHGLWEQLPNGALQLLVLEGQNFDHDGTGNTPDLTIQSIGLISDAPYVYGTQDGRGVAFNDSGSVAVRLTFTNGASGIYVFTPLPVPEPGCVVAVGLIGLGVAGGARRWRRRRPT
jgi:hypothetical protein